MKPIRQIPSLIGSSLVLMVGLYFMTLTPAVAQTFIQPPAAPPGGNSAGWLTTGTSTERKLGSLLVGSSTTPSSLCLNAAVTEITNPATTKCIASWSSAISLAGGPFVPLRTTGLAAANQSDPTWYFTTPGVTNLGAASIQGSGPNQAFSLIAEANPDNNAGYGLFAGDGGDSGNFAAQFSGRVAIGNTILSTGLPGPVGQLCLNDTALYTPGSETGCISTWGDLVAGPLTGFVKLQSGNQPLPEFGTAAASKVGNFGVVIFGQPPAGQPAKTFCGDSICSAHISEDIASDPNFCQLDCSIPNPPANLVVISTTTVGVNLSLVGQAQIPAGNVNVLVARSTNPTFSSDFRSAFVPQNGVTYTKGQIINGVTIAEARALSSPGYTYALSDLGLTTKTTYYYRLYQANMFPVYNTAPLTVAATTQ